MTKPGLTQTDEATLERLRSTIWYTVEKIVEEECKQLGTEPTPQFTASLASLVFNQCITLGEDLESFANHAKRKTISTDDVLMVCRRNDGLKEAIEEFVDGQSAEQAE